MTQDSETSRVLGLAHGQVCYLQLPAVSTARAAAFYAAVFGDLDQTLHQVTTHGGQISEPPSPDGPDRTLATILDPEGNPIGLAAR